MSNETLTSQQLYDRNMAYIKTQDDSTKVWKIEFWKQNFILGYWLVILLTIVVLIMGNMIGFW